ncbi:hypothetical protein [Amycolatopsis lurida]|uniref:hypothetical protein n=1 Tax=Amycolatopsis lurida TaxID=31959 RepID=UPI000B1D3C69|nr:hypothetical protein [Amycolatopsis lurida]
MTRSNSSTSGSLMSRPNSVSPQGLGEHLLGDTRAPRSFADWAARNVAAFR